jgi:hypothetical protein
LMISIVIFSCCISIPRLVLMDKLKRPPKICFYIVEAKLGVLIFQVDNAVFNYVPCIIIFFCNIFILVALYRSKGGEIRQKRTGSSSNEIRILMSLMLVSTIYVILLSPYAIAYTFYVLHEETDRYSALLYNITAFLLEFANFNYCMNFIIYSCTLSFYQEEVVRMLTWPCSPQEK